MAGIEDLIKVYRGDSRFFDGKKFSTLEEMAWEGDRDIDRRFRKTSGRWYSTDKDRAKTYSNFKNRPGTSGSRKLKEVTMSKADFEKGRRLLSKTISGGTLAQVKERLPSGSKDVILLPKKNIKDIKVLESNLIKDGLDMKKGKVKLTLENLKRNLLKTIASNTKGFSSLAMKGLSIAASLPAQVVLMTLVPTKMGNAEINMQLEDFAQLAENNNIEMGSNMDKALPGGDKDI